MIGVIILIFVIGGCKKEEQVLNAHKDEVFGTIIEVRDNNEILIKVTSSNVFEDNEVVLIKYTEYYWINPQDTTAYQHEDEPKLNDSVGAGFWKDDVLEKDGYAYLSDRQVTKFQRDIEGRVIHVRGDNEILIEVTKKSEEYEKGDNILVRYKSYYWINTDDIQLTEQEDTPEYNDRVKFGYWQENVGEKEGEVYMTDIYVRKYSYEIN